jgi:NDP-sugar pyrophosphorylase family protein
MSKKIKEYESEAANTQIVMAVGGSGKRMGTTTPKALMKVGDDTLLDRCVNYFANCGFRDFIFLLGYQDKEITEHIAKSSWANVRIKQSYDYAQGISKGKAFKYAMKEGKIDRSRRSILAFPDDVFLDDGLPITALLEHAHAARSLGTIASAVVAKAHRSAFGIAQVNPMNLITSFEEKPLVPMYSTVGMYIFEPRFYDYADRLVNLKSEGPLDFETAVLPELARENKVYAVVIPPDSWIPVNTNKELEQAQKLVDAGVLPKR